MKAPRAPNTISVRCTKCRRSLAPQFSYLVALGLSAFCAPTTRSGAGAITTTSWFRRERRIMLSGKSSRRRMNRRLCDRRLGTDVAEVRLGATHACVKKLDGSIVCWGNNLYGQSPTGRALTMPVHPMSSPKTALVHRPRRRLEQPPAPSMISASKALLNFQRL